MDIKAKEEIKKIEKKIEFGLGECFLIFMIILDILEFLDILPTDLDYIKRIVSWAIVGYLLYKVDLTEIFFGYKDRMIDISLIIAYFLLIMKNFVVFAATAAESIGTMKGSFLMPLYTFITDNAYRFEVYGFYAGIIMLLFIASLNLFLNFEIKKPSIMAILFKEGPASGMSDRIKRTFASLFIFTAFFIVVFNLIIEWLAWVIDSSITFFAILFYILFFIKYSKKFHPSTFIYKIGNVGETFYSNFIELFKSKETITLGMAGILLFHLLSDGGIFIFPYIIGRQVEYYKDLGPGHETIPFLVKNTLSSLTDVSLKVLAVGGYILNIIAALMLLLGPLFIWYELYNKKRIPIRRPFYFIFFLSVAYLILNPIFSIGRISKGTIYGVDIITKPLLVDNLFYPSLIAVIIGAAAVCFTYIYYARRALKFATYLSINVFFCIYIAFYLTDLVSFYLSNLFSNISLAIKLVLALFFFVTIIFYAVGSIYFVYLSLYKLYKKEA
ncbi:MAG: hypothetical protein N3D84_03230 [Candidatus Woesearchaeota archaeon]|nr:hypothetical protein [Candidatus Woesearchaeota archaeon]